MGTNIKEVRKHILSTEDIQPEELLETNDLKLAASFIVTGIGLISVRHVMVSKDRQRPKPEVFFGFRKSQHQHDTEISFLSGTLMASAQRLLDTRDRLISYIANGHRNALHPVTEEVVGRSHSN